MERRYVIAPFEHLSCLMQQKGKGGLWVTTDKHVLVNFSSLVAEVVLHSGVAVYEKKNHNQFAIVFFSNY